MKKRFLILMLLALIVLSVPVFSKEITATPEISPTVIAEDTVSVDIPEQSVIDQIFDIVVPTKTPDIKRPVVYKSVEDRLPKVSVINGKTSLTFSKVVTIKNVVSADNRNETVLTSVIGDQLELPGEGRIAVRIETQDMIYIIRRNT